MAVGDRIKRIRKFRGLTQRELGVAVGFDEKNADVRIAQYESGTRTPKEDKLKEIADALDVNYRALYEPSLYAAEDVMFTLFELDEHHSISLFDVIDDSDPTMPEKHIGLVFHYSLLNEFFAEWQLRKKELADGIITKSEYMEWKVNWPSTADGCGKYKLLKQWRKE